MPGYGFISAVFPGKFEMGGLERAIFSAGFSIVIVPIMGYILNFTAWGVRLEPMTVSITAFTTVCCCIANWRRHGLPENKRFSVDFGAIRREAESWVLSETQKGKTQMALSAAVVVCLVICIMAAAYMFALPWDGGSYTEFYINGPGGKAVDYPSQFTLGEQKPVIVGIVNEENRDVSYLINVSLVDRSNRSTIYSEQIKLADNQTWEKLVYLKPDRAGTNMTVDFALYADGEQATPYRECALFVNVSAVPP
jgi:uncharacterized membrane protein